MKQQAKILSVRVGQGINGNEYFDCFLVKPTTSKRSIYLSPDINLFPETEELSEEEILFWAEAQVGKSIFFEDTVALVYETVGKTYIV